MKKILIAVGVVAVVVAGGVVLLPRLVDLDSYKAQVAAVVEQHTGRALTIAGPIELSLFPTLGVRIEDVALANAPGAAEAAMVRLEALTVAVKLMPLLSGNLVVDSFVLERPVAHLEIDAKGNPNWVFAGAKASDAGSGAGGGTAAADERLRDVSLGDVRITRGAVSFVDHASGQRWTAEDLDMTLSLASLDAPAALNGKSRWNGRAVSVAATVQAPRALMEGRPSQVSLKLDGPLTASFDGSVAGGDAPALDGRFGVATKSVTDLAAWAGLPLAAPAGKDLGALDLSGSVAWPGALDASGRVVFGGTPVEARLTVAKLDQVAAGKASPVSLTLAGQPLRLSFEGTAKAGEAPRLDGRFATEVPSLRGLAAWAGQPLADDLAPGKLELLEVKGTLAAAPDRAAVSDLAFRLDDLRATGRVAANWGGARPALEAELAAGPLDLDPYLPPPAPKAAAPAGRAAPAAATDWSDDPIDVSGLKALDARLSLSAESITARQLRLGTTQATLQLQNGRADLALKRADAYGGRIAGAVVLDGSGPVLALRSDLDAKGVQLLPLLQAAAEFDRLEGTGELAYALAASGNSERALISSLQGKGNLRALDGAIVGVNIGAMVRNVSGAFTGQAGGEAAKTDFAELGGAFTITDGVLRNDDLRLLAPLFRLGGAGTVDLPRRSLHYRVEPRLAATAKGQGSSFERAGLMVPVIAEGPWSNIAYRPDLTAVRPEDVVGAVKDIRKDAAGAVKDLVGGLTGQRPPAAADQPAPADQPEPTAAPAPAPAPLPASPLDLLRQLR